MSDNPIEKTEITVKFFFKGVDEPSVFRWDFDPDRSGQWDENVPEVQNLMESLKGVEKGSTPMAVFCKKTGDTPWNFLGGWLKQWGCTEFPGEAGRARDENGFLIWDEKQKG